MLVHADKAGKCGVAREVQLASRVRLLDRRGTPYGEDAAVIDHDGLVGPCRRACAIDHTHVLKSNDRVIEAQERLNSWRETALGKKHACPCQQNSEDREK